MRNKFLTKILGATLGLTMAIGVGVGVAANNKAAKEVSALSDSDFASLTLVTSSSTLSTSKQYVYGTGKTNSSVFLKATATQSSWGEYTSKLSEATLFSVASSGTLSTSNFYLTTGTYNISAVQSKFSCITSAPAATNHSALTAAGTICKANATDYTMRYNSGSGWRWYNTTSTSAGFLYEVAASFGTLDHIKITTQATKRSFAVGETFSSAGLVLTGYDGANEASANTQTYSSGFTTSLDDHVFVPSDRGNNKTVTVTYSGKTTTYTIDVSGADIFLNYDNSPFGEATSASSEEATVEVAGIQYKNKYGYNYSKNKTIEFGKSTEAYLGNYTVYTNDIDKIVLNWQQYNNSDEIDVYACTSSLSTANAVEVEASNNGLTSTYTFDGEYPYFKICVNSDAHFMEFKSILVFFGGIHHDVDTVSAVIADKTYYAGTAMSSSDFSVTVTWTNGKADTHPTEDFTWTVNGVANGLLEEKSNNKVIVTYRGVSSVEYDVAGSPAAAKDVINSTLKTKASLTYHYSKETAVVTDTLTYDLTGVTGTSYSDWASDIDGTSGAVYAGKTAAGNDSIQLNNNDKKPGIVTKTSGGKAVNVSVSWNSNTSNGRTIQIYGKDSAYSAVTDLYNDSNKGTLIGSISKGTSTSLAINDDYSYIGILATGALYLDSIEIDWAGSSTYEYSDVKLRFSGLISSTLWGTLDSESDIEGYGFMISYENLGVNSLEYWYREARKETATIEAAIAETFELIDGKNFYKPISDGAHPEEANSAQKGEAPGTQYIWNLYKTALESENELTEEQVRNKLNASFVAVAYIRIDGDLVFLQQSDPTSATGLASAAIASGKADASTADGSLKNLADMLA